MIHMDAGISGPININRFSSREVMATLEDGERADVSSLLLEIILCLSTAGGILDNVERNINGE
jgi:hypothetical protein